MIEVLQFYVSGFWIWAGITFGIALVTNSIALASISLVKTIRKGKLND